MPKQTIRSDEALNAIGTYSQAMQAGDTVYCSGKTGSDAASGALVEVEAVLVLEQ